MQKSGGINTDDDFLCDVFHAFVERICFAAVIGLDYLQVF